MYIIGVVTGAIIAFILAMVNGANGVGNVIGVISVYRLFKYRTLLLISMFSMATGALLVGEYISRTYSRGVVYYECMTGDESVIISTLISIASSMLWGFIMLRKKIPISISQMTIGGLVGSTIGICGVNGVQWSRLYVIIASWIITPLLSMALSILVYYVSSFIESKKTTLVLLINILYFFTAVVLVLYLLLSRFIDRSASLMYSLMVSTLIILSYFLTMYAIQSEVSDIVYISRWFSGLSISLFLAFTYGAHDIGNSAGPLSTIISHGLLLPDNESLAISLYFTTIGLIIGAYLWGHRIIETVGGKITPLTPFTSLIVQLSMVYTMFILISAGIPSSFTLTMVGSIAGVGYARGLQYVDIRTLLKINVAWITGVLFVVFFSFLISYLYVRAF